MQRSPAAYRFLAAVLTAAVSLAASASPGLPENGPETDARRVCPAVVTQLLAADPGSTTAGNGPARVFGIAIAARVNLPPSTYRLILANDERVYSVPLPLPAADAGDRHQRPPAAPVYVRFAHPTTIRDAWVGAVESAGVQRICGPNNVLTDRPPIGRGPSGPLDRSPRSAALVAGAANATIVDVDESDSRPAAAPTCAVPEARPATLAYEPVKARIPGMLGRAIVIISLDENSEVAAARIDSSEVGPTHSAEAIRVARASRYQTTIYRCHPIPADFAFVVNFR
jgi:hypothetical protein